VPVVEEGATSTQQCTTEGNDSVDHKAANISTSVQSKPRVEESPEDEEQLHPKVSPKWQGGGKPEVKEGEHCDWHADLQKLRVLVRELMSKYTCYDLIPESGKIVIFDERLPIKHAFFALVQNDIKCAPV